MTPYVSAIYWKRLVKVTVKTIFFDDSSEKIRFEEIGYAAAMCRKVIQIEAMG